jgi:hypothetical protein
LLQVIHDNLLVPTGSAPAPKSGPTPSGPTPSGPTPSGPTPSGPTPSGPTPSGPTPSGPTPSGPTPSHPTPVSGPPQPWNPTKTYQVGDIVTYQGNAYQCLQAHTAEPTWTPTAVPSLWKEVTLPPATSLSLHVAAVSIPGSKSHPTSHTVPPTRPAPPVISPGATKVGSTIKK